MDEEVLVETRGRLGILALNRPKALNALSLGMIGQLQAGLTAFEHSSHIDAVLIRGAGERAFCAGGDVRALGAAPPGPEADRQRRAFFAGEYALNHHIWRFPKPFIAVIDGITMGGGCGLSLHGSHRVATERTLLAMPETVLGLFPDVGATRFLNKLPGEMGVYLALTGLRLKAADLMALRMATHQVASAAIGDLIEALAAETALESDTIDAVLDRFGAQPEPSAIEERRNRVDALFGDETVEEIAAALSTAPEDWAGEALTVIRRASPTSLKTTLRQLRGGRGLPVDEIFRIEYRLAVRITGGHDFREGVRAILIDKDNAARWNPARLEDVSPEAIEALFLPLAPDERELELG